MIDRSRVHYCLRGRTLGSAALISVGLFSFLPVVTGLCWLGGFLLFALFLLIMLLMLLLSVGACIGGVIAIIGGIGHMNQKYVTEEQKGQGCGIAIGGLVLFGIGYGLQSAFQGQYEVVQAMGMRWMVLCQEGGTWVWTELFLHFAVWFWSWIVLTVALSAAALVLVAIGLLRLEHPLKYALHRVGYTCTHCQHRGLPLFRSACGQLHDDLRPGFYGVWKARCGHCRSERLPTSDLAGRLRLPKVCAKCKHDLGDTGHGRHGEFHFVVVGAPSSSKSMLMLTAVWRLIEDFAAPQGIQCEFTDKAQERYYNDSVALLRRGQRLPKTDTSDHPRAFTLTLKPPAGPARRIYLYDAAGERFTAGDTGLAGHGITRHIDGILFLIDPFAEAGVRRTLDSASLDSLSDLAAPARNDAQDILVQVLPFWERMFGGTGSATLPVPLAVVVTKVDMCGLETRLGTPPDLRGSADVAEAAALAESRSERVRSFLEKHGLANLVDTLEQRFGQRARYFAASAQGRAHRADDATPFRPRGVLGPLIWLGWQASAFSDAGLGSHVVGNLAEFLRRGWRGREGPALQIVLRLLVAAVLGGVLGTLWWLGGWLLIGGGLVAILLGAAAWNRYQTVGVRDLVPTGRFLARLGAALRLPNPHDTSERVGLLSFAAGIGLVGGVLLGWLWWPLGLVFGLCAAVLIVVLCCRFWES